MAVSIPQVVTEDRASGALVIDGSLRFDKSKSQYLTRTPGVAGNRKKSTISYWIKRTIPVASFSPTTASVFGVDGTSSWFDLSYYTVDEIQFVLNAGVADAGMRTQASYRDFSSWYHICAVLDTDRTNDDGANSRMRVWVNGKETVQKATSSGQPAAGTSTFLNDSSRAHFIGRDGRTSSIRYGDNYLAQFYIVDGLVLGPDHFGYYDPLTNVWRPKKFTADGTTINDGRSWSGTSSVSNNNGNANGAGSLAAVFNGTMTANSSNAYGFTTGAMDFTWTPNTPIPFGAQVRVWTGFSGGTVYLNGTEEIVTTNNNAWTTLTNGRSGKITSIRFVGGSGGGWWAGVEVDGVVLVDSTTQNLDFGTNGCYLPLDGNSPIGQDQSGKGNNWTPVNFGGSTDITKATGALPILNTLGGTVARAGVFGSEVSKNYTTTSNTAAGSGYEFDQTSGFNPSLSFVRGATYTFDYTDSSSHPLRFSSTDPDSSVTSYTDGTNTSVSNTVKITVPHNAPDTLYYYCTSHNSMNGRISVTTDVTKADPYAWKCILALPLTSPHDVSGDMNCTTTNDSITNNSVSFNNDQSVFYNQSADPDGSQYFSGVDLSSWATDSPWTVEFWWYRTGANTNNHGHFVGGTIGGTNQYGPTYRDADSDWQFNYKGQNVHITPSPALQTNKWEHHAFTSDGNNITYFRDGVFQTTASASGMTGSWGNSNEIFRGGAGWSSQYVVGHVCDMRVYAGVEKYTTAGFIPASTNPDILPDTPSGVGTKTQLTKITDGAVSFEGTGSSSDTNYLSIPSSSDFAFGTGDFTIEYFLYLNSTPSVVSVPFDMRPLNTNGAYPQMSVDSTLTLKYYVNTNYRITGTTGGISLNKWVHIALSRSGTSTKMFVDGIQTGNTYSDSINYLQSGVTIGSNQYSTSEWGIPGFISNFRVIKGTALYTSNFIPPTRALTNITNTKLLCCQSNTSATAAAVTPGEINLLSISGYRENTSTTNQNWDSSSSASSTSSALNHDELYWIDLGSNQTVGQVTFDVVASGQSSDSAANYIIYYSTASNSNGSSVCNGGCTQTFVPIATGTSPGTYSVTVNFPTAASARYIAITNGNSGVGGTYVYSNAKVNAAILAATNFNPFTDDINAVRGQEGAYATLNPLISTVSLSDGNLKQAQTSGTWNVAVSSIPMSTGKWYCEVTLVGGNTFQIGIIKLDDGPNWAANFPLVDFQYGWGMVVDGVAKLRSDYIAQVNGRTDVEYNSTAPVAGDTIGMAYDADTQALTFYVNGISYGDTTSYWIYPPTAGEYVFGNSVVSGTDAVWNFGQKPFKFPPPDGFQPLTSSTVRPDTVVPRPDRYFDVTTYTGTNASKSISNLRLKPDLVWIKNRTGTQSHVLVDSVRGRAKSIYSDATYVENTSGSTVDLVSFDVNGFTLGPNNQSGVNTLNASMVAWTWKAGGNKNTFNIDDVGYVSASAAGLTAGTITPTGASVGTKQGFSIIRYTGNGSQGATLSHGLNEIPRFVVIKNLDNTQSWDIYHASSGYGGVLRFSTTKFTSAGDVYPSSHTTSTIKLGNSSSQNNDTEDHIAYIWHDVPGLQKFGSYESNSSGVFVELGFRPALLVVKNMDATLTNSQWNVVDTQRDTYNPSLNNLAWDRTNSEPAVSASTYGIDILSNGFAIPSGNTGEAINNTTSTQTYIYCAWAEQPAFNLYGAQSNAR